MEHKSEGLYVGHGSLLSLFLLNLVLEIVFKIISQENENYSDWDLGLSPSYANAIIS